MKISIFGLTLSSSWGNGHATPYRAIVRALAGMGHSVTFYEKDVHYYAAHRDLPQPDFCELVLYDDWANVRRSALECAAESDVVMTASYCPDGSQIADEVLEQNGPVKIFYDLDTPITLAKLRSGEKVEYIRSEQLREFELVLSWTNAGFNLQSAPTMTSTFTNIPGATSPYTNSLAAPRQFFRLAGN